MPLLNLLQHLDVERNRNNTISRLRHADAYHLMQLQGALFANSDRI